MAIEKNTYLYEVLVRLDAGSFVGGHAANLERVIDTESGERISEKVLPPRAITQDEVGALLGAEVATLIQQLDTARDDIASREATIVERDTTIAERDGEVARLAEAEEAATAAHAEELERLAAEHAAALAAAVADHEAELTSVAGAHAAEVATLTEERESAIAALNAEIEQLQAALNPPPGTDPKSLIEARAAAEFAAGYTPHAGPLAGHTLQVRDVEDRTNWLTSQASYAAAIAAGYGDVVDASFRTAANETITLSYAEGYAALLGMAAWGKAIMARSWALKDALAAGTLDEAAINAGWPSNA